MTINQSPPVQLHFVESSWRLNKDEVMSRLVLGQFWSSFPDLWRAENGHIDLRFVGQTVYSKASLLAALRAFGRHDGPGIMIVGAHGSSGKHGQWLHLLGPQGGEQKVRGSEVMEALTSASAPRQKALLFDACSFLHHEQFGKDLAATTGFALTIGFKEAVSVVDGLALEAGLVNWLLAEPSYWMDADKPKLPEGFLEAYETLAAAEDMAIWDRKGRSLLPYCVPLSGVDTLRCDNPPADWAGWST